MVASAALVLMGIADMRASGRSGSLYLTLGLIPALLAPIGFVYFVRTIPVVRAMRRGTTAIARWTVSADEFRQFQEADARMEAESRTTNFYEPPRPVPSDGVEVIFSNDGVLIGEGYFPLSTTSGRRVTRVHTITRGSPMIEFGTMLSTRVRTSSASMQTVRIAETLRVPVASDSLRQANDVARQFDIAIARR